MGKKSKAPKYPTTTVDTGLFGKSTTNKKGSTFKPTEFQKNLIGVTEQTAIPSLQNYINPNYDSDEYKQGDEYYTNKMNNMLENNYLAPALSRNLLRGSSASDIMRGFANDLAASEYERQQDYRNQQLENYKAAMLPYTQVYDMSVGTQGLSNSLANSIGNYNLQKYQLERQGGSGLGAALGAVGTIGGAALGGPVGSALGGALTTALAKKAGG